jgi:hypothetical protein
VKYGPDQNDELSNTSTNRPGKKLCRPMRTAPRLGCLGGCRHTGRSDTQLKVHGHRIVTLVRGPHQTAPSRRMAEHDRRRLPRGEGQTARARGPLPAPGSGCVRVNFEVDKGAWPSVAGTGRATAACRPRPGREPQAAAAPDTAGAGRPRPRFCNLRGQMLGPGWQCTQWQGHRRGGPVGGSGAFSSALRLGVGPGQAEQRRIRCMRAEAAEPRAASWALPVKCDGSAPGLGGPLKGPPTVHWLDSPFYPARAAATVASPAGPPSTRARVRVGTGMPAAALPPQSPIACSVTVRPAGATLPGPRTLPACGHHHDAAGPLPVPCQKRPVSLAHERQNPARVTSMETPVVRPRPTNLKVGFQKPH